MTAKTLIIRADASARVGTGHVMRCLALAEPWRAAGSQVILVAQQLPDSLAEKAKAMGVILRHIQTEAGSTEDAKETYTVVKGYRDAWLVVDGYQFDEAYQQALKAADVKVLLVDDFSHAKNYCVDYVLNQNLGITPEWYPERDEKTRLLLGTRYVQLRGEFFAWRNSRLRSRGTSHHGINILVTLGGSDPDNVTETAIEALKLAKLPNAVITVIVGGSNPHWDTLEQTASKIPGVRLRRNVSDMAGSMMAAQLAIAAGGTTAWELAYCGVPMMTIVLANNQKSNSEQLAAAGVSINLGWHTNLTSKALAKKITSLATDKSTIKVMAEKARKLVDGLGSMRVWLRLNADLLNLRIRISTDAESCAPNYSILVATDAESDPIVKIQFLVTGLLATVSANLDAIRCKKNQGSLLIWAACKKFFSETDIREVHAKVKQDDKDVVQAYENAGFALYSQTTMMEPKNLHYILHCQDLVD